MHPKLKEQWSRVDHVSLEVNALLREYFNVHGPGPLSSSLPRKGLCPADVVLALLSLGRQETASMVAGCRLQVLPPDPKINPKPLPGRAAQGEGPDHRRITWVGENPFSPRSKSAHNFSQFRVGTTVAQALKRGATRRDVRTAVRRGALKLEGDDH